MYFSNVAVVQWFSSCLSIGRLCVRPTATVWIAVALLGQERSRQPPGQEASFRLRPATNCCHQNQIQNKQKHQSVLSKELLMLLKNKQPNRESKLTPIAACQWFWIGLAGRGCMSRMKVHFCYLSSCGYWNKYNDITHR